MPEYVYKAGSRTEAFHQSTIKFQLLGGGYGSGKTTAALIKILRIAIAYPGSLGLVARATVSKLMDTTFKSFVEWCPPGMIKELKMNDDRPIIVLHNGSVIHFRYIQTTVRTDRGSTFNLLSASYDWIFVDQLDDPEFSEGLFLQLYGRLRGMTRRADFDEDFKDWPLIGPNFIIATANPTQNWLFTVIVKPYLEYERTGKLRRDQQFVKDGKLDMVLFNLPSNELAHVYDAAGSDYIQSMESAFDESQRKRYIEGKWEGFTGQIYSDFSYDKHVVDHGTLEHVINMFTGLHVRFNFIEGYDYGIAEESCYILGVVDHMGNVHLADGFYEKECPIDRQAKMIKDIRKKWGVPPKMSIAADPSIFKRVASPRGNGTTVVRMFNELSLDMHRGNNEILAGITRVKGYMHVSNRTKNPYTGVYGAAKLYISENLTWLIDEIGSYYWKADANDKPLDVPRNSKDHALDALKYMLSYAPDSGTLPMSREDSQKQLLDRVGYWREQPMQSSVPRSYRHV